MSESKMLKVTGIIMIVGGALMLVFSIIGYATGALAYAADVDGINATLLALVALAGLVMAVIDLIAGIMGVRNWNKPAKAQGCFIMGIVLIILSLFNNIMTIVLTSTGFNVNMLVNILIGLIVPVLYTYGAAKLKKGA